MKRILLTIICVVAVIFAHAEGHMRFKGIEIDGDLNSFKSKLEEQGFYGITQDGVGLMTGRFTGDMVLLSFSSTPVTDLVYQVMVIYPSLLQWSHLEKKYNGLVESLKNKYGEPDESIWDVNEDSNPQRELIMDRATIVTRFKFENGGITTGIMNIPLFGVGVYISYWDKENRSLYDAEVVDDL